MMQAPEMTPPDCGGALPPAAATVSALVDKGARRLGLSGIPSARLDAELLLAHAIGADRTAIHTRAGALVSAAATVAYDDMLERRAAREPLAYIVGYKEFWSMDFCVTPAVLIPRPETEVAVEVALELLRSTESGDSTVCDVGTGSGCIAVALARELPHVAVVGVDVSVAALEVAQANAVQHGVDDRIELIAGDLLSAVRDRRFDVVITNPPYVASGEIGGLEPELRREPAGALDGGADGLAIIRRLFVQVAEVLKPGGWLVMEIGADQGAAVVAIAAASGFGDVSLRDDYAGQPRVLVARVS